LGLGLLLFWLEAVRLVQPVFVEAAIVRAVVAPHAWRAGPRRPFALPACDGLRRGRRKTLGGAPNMETRDDVLKLAV
jgi:hypothetical protein